MNDDETTDQEMEQDEALAENEGTDAEDAEIIARARRNFKIAQESESQIRKDAMDDFKFRVGEQWPDDIKNARSQDKRPCLTINRIPQFTNQVINDCRQNRPAIQVDPTGQGAREETAEVIQGLIRHIEYASSADVAYDTAVEHQVTGGFGFFRITTEYENEMSFDQEIRIKRVRNPFSVLLDPSYQEPDGSDTNWGHVFDEMTKDEFKSQWPDSKLSQMNDWESQGQTSEGWVTQNGCRITEYFEKTLKRTKLYLLNTGDTILAEDMPKPPAVFPTAQDGTQISIAVDDQGQQICRDTVTPGIKWYKMNGIEILERTDFPGKWIPIIPVLGCEFIVDGKRILEGVVRHAKDPQRMYNFWASSETETIALAPRAPWIGAKGQFEGFEDRWETANTQNHAFLEYNETTTAGKPVGPPQRNTFEPPVQAITNARMASAEDLKATTGIYDASLGNRSNEVSGRAIERRTNQAQTSNFHYSDNLGRSIRHAGRIMVGVIPHVYDTARMIRIIDEEDEQKIVQINQVFQDGADHKVHRFDIGTYDVAVSQGPSFATKRQEAAHAMLDLTKAYPQAFGIMGDLMIRNMDWPGKDAIADRFKKTLPPNLIEDDKDQKVPPQAQQQMQQMQKMIQELSGKLAAADDMIKTDMLKTASKERIEMAKLQAEIEIELARLGHQGAEVMLDHQVAEIQQRIQAAASAATQNGSSPAGPNGAGGNPSVPTSTGGPSPG